MDEFHGAKKGQNKADGIIPTVADHKLKSHQPASIVISTKLFKLMVIYEKRFRQLDDRCQTNSSTFGIVSWHTTFPGNCLFSGKLWG